jgi:hypothetical protein
MQRDQPLACFAGGHAFALSAFAFLEGTRQKILIHRENVTAFVHLWFNCARGAWMQISAESISILDSFALLCD